MLFVVNRKPQNDRALFAWRLRMLSVRPFVFRSQYLSLLVLVKLIYDLVFAVSERC